MGVPRNVLELVKDLLQANIVVLDDGVAEHEPIVQTNGFAQGDNISPLLFSLLVGDLPSRITKRHPLVKVIMYADDLVMYSGSRFHLQQALATLAAYVVEVGLEINTQKTEAMKFRRGGRLAESDTLLLNGEPLKYVNTFTYLGITLTPSGKSYKAHIEERVRKALVSAVSIAAPQRLSMETALSLFRMKIAPAAAYGIQLYWEKLTSSQLTALDRVKPAFLKRVMGLHTSTKNRLVYLLASTPLFIEELRYQHSLPETPAYHAFIRSHEDKMASIDAEFYLTKAMNNSEWKDVSRTNRHIVTRYAVHGFHNILCRTEGYHEPNDTCICKYCELVCPR